MKYLQFACMVGAVAALSLLASRGPSNVGEPVRVHEPVRAEKSLQVNEAQAPTAKPRGTMVASAETLPDQFSRAPAAARPLSVASPGLAYAVPDVTLDPTSR